MTELFSLCMWVCVSTVSLTCVYFTNAYTEISLRRVEAEYKMFFYLFFLFFFFLLELKIHSAVKKGDSCVCAQGFISLGSFFFCDLFNKSKVSLLWLHNSKWFIALIILQVYERSQKTEKVILFFFYCCC